MNINKDLYFKNLRGYKIESSHFELGSNLHIGNYYYAKRIFYNSFYTNRFAFLIARYILNEFKPVIDDAIAQKVECPESTSTLMGFEGYAELLVSNVRKMLNDYLITTESITDEVFNHDIYTKDAFFLKNPKKIGARIISIFPISTTFSTSIRVQTEVIEQLSKICSHPVKFLNPVINCLVIPNRSLVKDHHFTLIEPESTFGWEENDAEKRIVTVSSHDYGRQFPTSLMNLRPLLNEKVLQYYMIHMPTDWQNIIDCKKCYPDDPAEEIALVETKLNPVTPNLVFSFPKTVETIPDPDFFSLFDIRGTGNGAVPLVYRRHFVKNNHYYIYYIRVGRFLQENKVKIQSWLTSLSTEIFHKGTDTDIVIITPSFGSNSGFPNLLNDLVFSDTATIIQFNPGEDELQNFKIFYADIIYKAGIVLFVNDVLATTETVSEINYYIRSVRKDQVGIDACICLINRAGYYDYTALRHKLEQHHPAFIRSGKSIVSFVEVDVFSISNKEKNNYLALANKFLELSTKSVLDGMRHHFRKKSLQFKPVDLDKEYGDQKDSGSPKSLLQFLLTHEFMKLFAVDHKEEYIYQTTIDQVFSNPDALARPCSYELLRDMVMLPDANSAISPFLEKYPDYVSEIKYGLFKLCTSEPFVNYKNIRQTAFEWILHELIITVEEINILGRVTVNFFSASGAGFSPYQTFRFLLKRGAKLKMNYIYSTDTLAAIKIILLAMDMPARSHRAARYIHPNTLIIYYVGLLQELIIDHEAKAVKVVMNVKKMILVEPDGKTLKNTFDDHFMHLLRLLVLENTFIFHTVAAKFLAKYMPEYKFGEDKMGFFDIFEDFKKSYAFQYARTMLSRFEYDNGVLKIPDEDGEPPIVKSFGYMLLLKTLLENDKKNDHEHQEISMRKKVEEILRYACGILAIENGGAFFAVNYKNKAQPDFEEDIAIVGEYNQVNSNNIQPLKFTDQSLLSLVFKGISENSEEPALSLFELAIDSGYNYNFRRNGVLTVEQLPELDEFKEVFYRNMLFLRITDLAGQNSNGSTIIPQGVICFYKDKLSFEESKKVRAQWSSDLPAIAHQTQLTFKKNTMQTKQLPLTYERFDPKKVRQLLLLRNNLGNFIEHHLSNDSLRNYIEQLNFENHNAMLRHSISTYESMVQTYIDKLQQEFKDGDPIKEQVDYLAIFFQYLVNKLHLLTLAQKLASDNGGQTHEFKGDITAGIIAKEFQEITLKIFRMEQSDLICLEDPNLLKLDLSQIGIIAADTHFDLSAVIMKEVVFELIYNIKKHTFQDCADDLSDTNPLTIIVALVKDGEDWWLTVTNNYSKKTEKFIERLGKSLIKRKLADGLSLIYNILYKLFDRQLSIAQQNDLLTVRIPLKLKNN